MSTSQDYTCPFCDLVTNNEYEMLLHVELSHSESGESPFAAAAADDLDIPDQQEVAAQDDSPNPASQHTNLTTYVECPFKCGERVPVTEVQFHKDFHLAEDMALDEVVADLDVDASTGSRTKSTAYDTASSPFSTSIPAALRNDNRSTRQSDATKKYVATNRRTMPSFKEVLFGSSSRGTASPRAEKVTTSTTKRLGRSELGPYAHEKQMPAHLQRMLEEGAKVTISNKIGPGGALVRVETVANETPNLVRVLARLSDQDKNVQRAFYCSDEVRHVAKMRNEGGFCGYRNLQMLISYIRDAKAPGYRNFRGSLPSIIKLQDMIEQAWDQGFNAIGRIETGGIKLTRKYIGTPEAQALLQSLNIPCDSIGIISTAEAQAHHHLLQVISEYFDSHSNKERLIVTNKPPIYFQHRGHSMTIVGVEEQKDGTTNLVVFDPMFKPSNAVKELINNHHFKSAAPATLLKAHRRGDRYLSKYKEFEILKIQGPPQEPEEAVPKVRSV